MSEKVKREYMFGRLAFIIVSHFRKRNKRLHHTKFETSHKNAALHKAGWSTSSKNFLTSQKQVILL